MLYEKTDINTRLSDAVHLHRASTRGKQRHRFEPRQCLQYFIGYVQKTDNPVAENRVENVAGVLTEYGRDVDETPPKNRAVFFEKKKKVTKKKKKKQSKEKQRKENNPPPTPPFGKEGEEEREEELL